MANYDINKMFPFNGFETINPNPSKASTEYEDDPYYYADPEEEPSIDPDEEADRVQRARDLK